MDNTKNQKIFYIKTHLVKQENLREYCTLTPAKNSTSKFNKFSKVKYIIQ